MNEEQLRAIELRANAATPGPWEEVAESGECWLTSQSDETAATYIVPDTALMNQDDIEFIAHAREDVPALIAEARRLQAQWAQVVAIADESARGDTNIGAYNMSRIRDLVRDAQVVQP